ncbi:MAG: amidohydrolase family protein, partial [Butyricicoccus sp.]|nr:amidohydrolase family protein [Butyricicoccus sp.]
IDPCLLAYDKDALDHDGNNAWSLYGREFSSAQDFLTFYEAQLRAHISDGCCAIKCAAAYDRGLHFEAVSRESADRVFQSRAYTQADITAFQDHVVDEVCALAADLDVPMQWHTGLGCLHGTGPLSLLSLIERHPRTKFVLFHGGYPWVHEIAALMHNFGNVYADLVWLPILSPTAAVQMLHELLEMGTADRICWGCDTKVPEESYGACIALADVLGTVLAQKTGDGYLTADEAGRIAENILYRNAQTLYKL